MQWGNRSCWCALRDAKRVVNHQERGDAVPHRAECQHGDVVALDRRAVVVPAEEGGILMEGLRGRCAGAAGRRRAVGAAKILHQQVQLLMPAAEQVQVKGDLRPDKEGGKGVRDRM